ncbi:MAG: SGNH/GDSL hydrolase family protein [Patescibacteria group bacterium]
MKRLFHLLLVVMVCGSLTVDVAHAANGSEWNWGNPTVKASRKVSPINSSQHEPNFLNNLDCTLMDYRQVTSRVMQTGCFTPTAFGLFDSDSNIAVFNGTDEGLPVLPYASGEILAPWPHAADLVVLSAANTGGSYVSLYKNPLASLVDRRNLIGQLTAKQLTTAPDLSIRDTAGKQLAINTQTLTFSDGGEWLVAETLSGSFVRINLATLDMLAFAPSFGAIGSPALLESRVATSGDGHYVAIFNKVANSFKVYDLSACSGSTTNMQPKSCQAYDYWPFLRQQIPGLQSIRHLRFVNSGLLSFEAQASNVANSGIYEIAPTDSINSLIDYLGLGDSYTSGEGAFDYLPGADTTNNMCHLSANSYPLLLTHDLFGNTGGHSVACSGAVINDIGSKSGSYRGQVSGVASFEKLQKEQASLLNSIMTNYLPGYVAQQQFVGQYQPKIVTVAIGGNDIGFGDIIQNCVMPHVGTHSVSNNCYDTYEDRIELQDLIDRTVPRWTSLYKQLVAQAPSTQFYAIGYPEIADYRGNCALNVHLEASELQFAEELIGYLNSSIAQAADRANIDYIDISQALVGHRLCETASYNVAVNGLTAGKDAGLAGIKVIGKESYHPNMLGHRLIEQAILRQTHNFAYTNKVTPTRTGQLLLGAPKTGRKIATKIPVSQMTIQIVKKGQSIHLTVDGSATGLRANTSYTVRLDGLTGVLVATVSTNNAGDINNGLVIPSNTTSGGHTLDIVGSNQTDETVDVTQPIYIAASEIDADDDGTSDTTDSCPSAANSHQDEDKDGVDDACDGFIGQLSDSTNIDGTGSVQVVATMKTKDHLGGGLGVSTVSPATTISKHVKPLASAKSTATNRRIVWTKHLDLVRWLCLLVVVWILILLAIILLKRYIDESEIRGSEEVLV